MPESAARLALTAAVVCGLFLCGCTGTPVPMPSQPTTLVEPSQTPSLEPSMPVTMAVSPAFQELRATLELFAREKLDEGASAVLIKVKAGQQEWTHAAGVRSRAAPVSVQPGDRFDGGDQLRTMVAVSVLKLVEEGRLALDDPINTHLPGSVPAGNPVTIRQLLGDATELPAAPSPQADTLLGLLVERLRGVPLETSLRTDILSPLTLDSTSLLVPGSATPDDVVHGYVQLNGETVDVTFPHVPNGASSVRLLSTVEDLTRFQATLLEGRLLAPQSLVSMKGSVFAGYGLGLDHWEDHCTNGSYYGHAGDVPGYGSITMSSADENRQLAIFMAYPPQPIAPQPSALALEMTGLAQVALNSSCRFHFR
ncbi:beta-lactamase family protein [Arthrobacter sp. AK01]|uniref:serine hydrolase domain-containing protein n=1 Tax=Arthrobacter sp. AK01 TaxID=2894084 RepID=UPI001E2BDC3D|nr:serine hydrolase domain-containing protein [Arthrobacter sp. AK01]MCD4852260.1 beta-lactamase family protein [Arthrobacter sp. AK01]